MQGRPLDGLRVLTLEHFGAGPYGTMLLAELGAEVIKIESPALGGDQSRPTGPFLLGADDSQFFQTFSRGKKSCAIEMKTHEGRADFERLVAGADAVANNMRGDQPEKLGLTYAHLKAIKPAIVCAHLSAYGRDNSRKDWPGYDYLMQAECGFYSLTGEPECPPARLGLSMVDFMTGTMMALGLVSAVMKARATGEGCDVDVSLFEVALHQLSYPGVWYLNEGHVTTRLPRGAHPSMAPSQMVRAGDGWMLVMCQNQKFWEIFCSRVGREDLASDARFIDPPTRRANLAVLTQTIDALLSEHPVAYWVELLSGHVPVAPVFNIAQALDNPFVAELGMIETVAHPDRPEGLRMLRTPLRIDGDRPHGTRAPKLGEHTAEIMKS
jgi:crotonobetainyl-CoA:carnitine CoA-transferase CaiB-like acyl-CoA transferase